MRIQDLKVRRVMRGEDAAAWAGALSSGAWLASSRILKHEPGSAWARRASVNQTDVVVKCRLLDRAARRVKASLGCGQGDRQWHAAARLAMKRIPCSRPVLLAHADLDGCPCELLVLRWAPGATVLDLLAAAAAGEPGAPEVGEQHEIARAVGATIPALLTARLWNRDHKPSNLVVDRDGRGRVRVTLIDLVGIKRYGWMGIDEYEAEQMAASLVIEPTGCGCRPRRALWMRALLAMFDEGVRTGPRAERHAALRASLEEIARLVDAHGDPRPRVDPLRPREPVPNGPSARAEAPSTNASARAEGSSHAG